MQLCKDLASGVAKCRINAVAQAIKPVMAALVTIGLLIVIHARDVAAAEPVGAVIIKIGNTVAATDGDFVVAAEASPLASVQATNNKRTIKLRKGDALNEAFEFTLAEDTFTWNITVTPPKSDKPPRPMFISGQVSLIDIVRALNEGEGQPVPYDFGPVRRPDASLLGVSGSPISMEFKNVRSASVAACVVFENYQGSEQPDYRLRFGANDNSALQKDTGIVTDILAKLDRGWCTRHITVISKDVESPFILEIKNPKTGVFEVRAQGKFLFESGGVTADKITTDPASGDPKAVSLSAVSVKMFGIRDSFEVTLGNPFLSTLGVEGLDKGNPVGLQLCVGSVSCQDVPAPRPSGVVDDGQAVSVGKRIVDYMKDHRRFAPLAAIALLGVGFLAFKRLRPIPA